MHANSEILIYSNEIHSSIHISMVLSKISLKAKSNVLIDLFNLAPLPNEQNKEESYMDVPTTTYLMGRIPDC